MAGKNHNLTSAKRAKNDEFYTQLTDIEKELVHYKDFLRGKIVFCNCDDPRWSNFWKYFHLNFSHIGLKKLIATHYDAEQTTYMLEYEGGNDANIEEGKETPLQQNGDFRSPECIKLLQEADVVVTNPPFSLFREYVAQLMEYGKKFIIIGNKNAVTYKEIFPLIKNNQLWFGPSITSGDREFGVPDGVELTFKNPRIDEHGHRYVRVPGVHWFTNVDHSVRHEPLTLFRRYYDDPSLYPHYDNYDAINVDKTADIPCDYFEAMGVPITFLDKYCPDQFDVIGATESEGRGFSNGLYRQTDRQTDRQRNLSFTDSGATNGCSSDARCNGIIGVPITFLDKYCPEQFEIIGLDRYVEDNPNYGHRFRIGGREIYARILIRRKDERGIA